MTLSWTILAFLVGWCWPIFLPWWWWWWWRWRWPWPRPPIPDPPPYEIPRFDWVSHIAGGIGGAAAWAGLGPDVAPDGGLLPLTLVALAGAATLGSVASGAASLARRDGPTTSA